MKKPSMQSRFLDALEAQLALAQKQLTEARQDIEFYRGKVERLELAIMGNPPAQQEYVQTQTVVRPMIQNVKAGPPQPSPHIAFSDLKRQWNALSAEEQEKAMQDGWEVNKKQEEPSNAG